MRSLFAVAVLFLSVSCLRADDQPKDGNVKNTRGKCSATFPGTPKLDADKTSDTYVLGENEDKQGYVLNVNSFKQKLDLADEEKITKAMDAMYLQLKSSLGTKASKMTKGTFGPDKLPSRYYEFDLADGGIYWTRAVLTENSIISITISGPKAWAQGEKAQAFIKSLKVDSGK